MKPKYHYEKGYKIVFLFLLSFLPLFSLNAKVVHYDTLSQKTIIIESDKDFPPFEFINEEGKPDGFNVELIKKLMEKTGLHYELKLRLWSEVTKNLEEKKIDMVAGMMYSHDRSSYVKFGIPHSYISQILVVQHGSKINSLSDLKGKKIIVQGQDRAFEIIKELNTEYDSIIYTNSTDDGLKLLNEEKGDVVMCSDILATYLIKKNNLKNLEIVKNISLAPQKYSFAVNTDNDELLYRLNAGLHQLKLTGDYDRIYDKWFSIYEKKDYTKTIWIIVGIVFLLAVGCGGIIFLLKTRIRKATCKLNEIAEALQIENNQRTISEEKLQRTFSQLKLAITAGNISAWQYDINLQVFNSLYDNQTSEEAISLEYFKSNIHPDDLISFFKIFNKVIKGEVEKATLNFRYKMDENDHYLYFEDKMMCIKNVYGKPINIIGTQKDITEQIRIQKQLTDYKTKTEFIINSAEMVQWEYDVEKHILHSFSSNSLLPSYIFSKDEILKYVHPDNLKEVESFFDDMDNGINSKTTIEYSIRNKTDYRHEVSIAIPFEKDNNGKVIRYAGLSRDNTSWHNMNIKLTELKEKADRSNQLKSAFLANMSHEIRTPLNAIVGFSELIKQCDDKDEKDEYSHIISINSELLLQLINDILDLSKIEAGYVDMNDTVFDMSVLVDELITSLSSKVKHGVKLISEKPKETHLICMDKNRMAQIITNYVTNAAKFTEKGYIKIGYSFDEKGIRIYVEDTGIGINEDKIEKVFARFEKLNNFAQGTGLGLSIVKSIAETRGGNVGVSSKINVGSTFWAYIPCELSENNQMDSLSNSENIIIKTTHNLDKKDKKTILVAEDNDSNYLLISTILKKDYNLLRAKNGQEAVDMAKELENNIDLIIMDIMMPIMDGLEATRIIRSTDKELPILALTAHAFDADRDIAIKAGCNDFIIKPININTLKETLIKYLN